MTSGYGLIFAGVVLNALGQLLLKAGTNAVGRFAFVAENIGPVLKTAVHRVTNCDCGEETSCYGCLRTYRNQRQHEELSRGAALRLLGGVT